MEEVLYKYKAKITEVYDGDTVTAAIDLGFSVVWHDVKIRLYGIDTPEIRGAERPEGLVARDYLRALILDKDVFLETIKDTTGKYGRYLGKIWFDRDGYWVCANDVLVEDGYAKIY